MIMDGSTWVAYKLFGVNRLSRSSPVAASSRPGTTVGGARPWAAGWRPAPR